MDDDARPPRGLLDPDRPLGAAGRGDVLAAPPSEVVLPGVPLSLAREGRDLLVRADGVELARLVSGPLEPDAAAVLVVEGEPAVLEWDAPRPGAWARPRRLVVRWRSRTWLLVAHGVHRELHPAGRGEGRPLVRLAVEGDGHRVDWSALAAPREVAVTALLVLGAGARAFRTARG